MKTDDTIESVKGVGGAFADALTWLRILMMPLVAFLIWKGWQPFESGGIDIGLTILASGLFAIGALTDIFDDFFGGNERSVHRRFGFLDDIADTILVIGTLAALTFVIQRAGVMSWLFFVPAAVLIGREIVVGLFKGYELSRYILPDSFLSNLKSGLSMFATCLLLASPWVQAWIDRKLTATEEVASVFATASPTIWIVGQILLWIAAIISVVTAIDLFRTDFSAANEP
jgi:phosphatidylglycerophosphate synthase